jgi:hypothetical protein
LQLLLPALEQLGIGSRGGQVLVKRGVFARFKPVMSSPELDALNRGHTHRT